MGSLLEELARREAAARKRIEEMREQIERLQENLTAEEQALSRLVVTRETVREILGEAASERPPSDVDAGIAGGVGGPGGASAAEAVTSGGSPVGVVTVPAWRPGTDASVLGVPAISWTFPLCCFWCPIVKLALVIRWAYLTEPRCFRT